MINFELDLVDNSSVAISIMDMNGRTIRSMKLGELEAGLHTIEWKGDNDSQVKQSSGIYFGHILIGDKVKMIKMSLQK